MNIAKSIALFATAAMLASAASAQVLSPGTDSFAEVGKEGPWTIYADANRKSCLIEGIDPAASAVVQMGLTSDHKLGYVGVFTPSNADMSSSDQPITIEVNGHAYSGTAKMREHGLADGFRGGYFLADNPQFIEDMMAGQKLVAFSDETGKGVEIDLTGSRAAIEAAAACTQQLAAQ